MKFNRVIGKCGQDLLTRAEQALSTTITELSLPYSNRFAGSGIGGDVFLYQLVATLPHICDARAVELDQAIATSSNNLADHEKKIMGELSGILGKKFIRTAATDGKAFYWCPIFVTSKSRIGLRLLMAHEGLHIIYMHPSRRGSRKPLPWNISVDFKANYTIIDDLRTRQIKHPEEVFAKELGDFVRLHEYAKFLQDPFSASGKLAHWNPITTIKQELNEKPHIPLAPLYFAEPDLDTSMQRPEIIYDYLISQISKCSTCGKIGVCQKPEEYKKLEKQLHEKLRDQNVKK